MASIAFLFNPATAPYADNYLTPFKVAAPSFGVEAVTTPVDDASEFETIIAAQARKPNSGLIVMPDPFPFVNRAEITSLAMRHRLPVVYSNRGYTEVGGLLSYGADLVENLRGAASYTDRILRGDKPRELPIQVPIKFELVINLKTAREIGLEVPDTLLARADEVIE